MFKDFDRMKYRQDIQEHELYLPSLYEGQPEIIAQNLQTIIANSLDSQAPVKRILIRCKHSISISKEAKELLVMRDEAHKMYKETGDIEQRRLMRHLKNQANKLISKEKFMRKYNKINQDNISDKDKWNIIKEETGQKQFKTPKLIIDKDKHYTVPRTWPQPSIDSILEELVKLYTICHYKVKTL